MTLTRAQTYCGQCGCTIARKGSQIRRPFGMRTTVCRGCAYNLDMARRRGTRKRSVQSEARP